MDALWCCMLVVLQLTSIYTCVIAADDDLEHHHHRAKRLADVVCDAGSTKIIPPIYYRDNAHDWCLTAAGSLNNDFYNMDYRLECQRWLGGDLPADVVQAKLAYCWEDQATEKVTYKMGVCCRGTTTEKRCFQGEVEGPLYWPYWESYSAMNYRLNYEFQVETCQEDETCQNRYAFHGSGGYVSSVTLTKGCAKTADCSADSSMGSGSCQDCVFDAPNCTTCCDTPFCNYDLQNIVKSPATCPPPPPIPRMPCNSGPCQNGGVCHNIDWINSGDDYGYNNFTCWCTIYWSGDNCSDSRPLCAFDPNPCLNSGVCYDRDDIRPGMYHCDCTQPYYGDHCELINGLTCNSSDSNYREIGSEMSTNINCTQLALLTKGHPEMLVWGGYLIQTLCADDERTAKYRLEFELKHCSLGNGPDWTIPTYHSCCIERTLLCSASLCQHGGTCYDYTDIAGGDNYRCECVAPYIGHHCELANDLTCAVSDPLRITVNSWYDNPSASCSDWFDYTHDNHYIYGDMVNYYCQPRVSRPTDGHHFVQGVDGQINPDKFQAEATYCARNAYLGFGRHEACCPSCLSSPCQNEGYCLQRTYNQHVCQCPIGYNGEFCEHRLSICLYTGEPHIKTFDNKMFDYQGTCKQILAKPCNSIDFAVFVEGEHREGIYPDVAFPKYVEVYIYGDTVRMERNPSLVNTSAVPVDLTINGYVIYPPYYELQYVGGVGAQLTNFSAWEVGHDGRFFRLQLPSVGLSVAFDGKWTIEVEIPTTLEQMCGLCGDNDGDPSNDLTLADGTDVRNETDARNLVGDSYIADLNCVQSNKRRKRQTYIDPTACDYDLSSCLIMNSTAGVFANCIRSIGISVANAFAAACVMDACYTGGESICLSVQTFVDLCTFNGATLPCNVWQTATNCPGDGYCPAGMIYKCLAPACRATCADPEGSDFCPYAYKDACVCPEGQLLFNGVCMETCPSGCLDDNKQLHLVGEEWPGLGCTTVTCNAVCENCTEAPTANSTAGCPTGTVCVDGGSCALVTTIATTPKHNNGKKPTTKSDNGIHLGQTTTATKKKKVPTATLR